MISSATRWATALTAAAMVAMVAAPVRADDDKIKAFEVVGDADAAAADARGVAVDDAFAQATADAVENVLSKAQRNQYRAEIDKEIVGRARRWVSSYRVVADQTIAGRRQLTVVVRIDFDLLRARLVALQILDPAAAADPGAAPVAAGDSAADRIRPEPGPVTDPSVLPAADLRLADPRWAGRTATLLLRVTRQTQALASFGASADRNVPGTTRATTLLSERGLVVKPAPLAGPSPGVAGDLPLDDDQARALASAANVELAVVVGADLSDRQQVRGLASPMVLASAAARVLAVGREVVIGVGRGSAVAIAGDGDREALDRAISAALGNALPTATPPRGSAVVLVDDQALPRVDGGAWVRVSARTPWSVVNALLRHLATQPGASAELRRLSPAGYLLLVRSRGSVERTAAVARSMSMPEGTGSLRVRSERGVIVVRVEP